MSAAAVAALAGLLLLVGLGVGYWLPARWRRPIRDRPKAVRRILVPFTGNTISKRAIEAAVRLARAENAVIMPAFLARVPRNLPLDAPLPVRCGPGMSLLEAIEQRVEVQGVDVDSRVARGRTYRDALRHLVEHEDFDRVIVSATASPRTGLSAGDVQWLLERFPAEVVILRPAATDERRISADAVAGHF